jgi:uncharacterized protein
MPKFTVLLVLCLALAVPSASAATANVALSQVYAGGGNSGATFANDYIELVNRGGAPVSVAGWTVQYASAASSSWQTVPLTGSIRAGGYYLVKLGSGGTAGAALPSADATGTINLAAGGGKVALVRDATELTCSTCDAVASIEDFVGWGTATDAEGSPADAPSSTTALVRAGAGCTDTNANAADFALGDPAPRTSASPVAACTGGTTPPGSTTSGASVSVDVQSMLSMTLERASVSFGQAFAGDTPTAVSERVTVNSNNPTGYALTVHRSAFAPADLPLGVSLAGGSPQLPIPIAPAADLFLASSSAATPAAGDVWAATIGFTGPLPAVPPGHYTATVTFTVIGR